MPRPTPEVLDGMRTPRAARQADGIKTGLYGRFRAAMADKLEAAKAARKAKVRETIFNSRYARLRVQLTAPRDVIDNETGRKTVGRPLFAQFTDSTFKVPRHLSDKDADETVRLLRLHPKFGLGGDFWEAADALDEGKLRKMAQVAQTIESDPDIKEGVLDYITAMEFESDVAEQASVRRAAGAEEGDVDADDEEQEEKDEDEDDSIPVVRQPRAAPPKATPPKRRGAPRKRRKSTSAVADV
jgi:hypothetical protein